MNNINYVYGMRLRGFSSGAQPMGGLLGYKPSMTNRYYDLFIYNRPLTEEEIKQYDLEFVRFE